MGGASIVRCRKREIRTAPLGGTSLPIRTGVEIARSGLIAMPSFSAGGAVGL